MRKAISKARRENARMAQRKALEEKGVVLNGKIHFPPFFEKRKDTLNPELIQQLQETADREPEVEDDYGKYKTGTFLHRTCIVTVTRENGLWMVHIFTVGLPITLQVIQEVRDKYIPNYCMMVQFYPSRQERILKGIQLCEMPGSIQEDETADDVEDAKEAEA